MKKCSKCGEVKELTEFIPNKNSKDNRENKCKKCFNKERSIVYHRDIKPVKDLCRAICSVVIKLARPEYQKEYKKNNPERTKKNNKTRTNKLSNRISGSIRRSFRVNGFESKGLNISSILGCSYEEFRIYIESLWQPWMKWSNYGKKRRNTFNHGWDFDHIIPSSSAITEEDIIRLNHYTNFQPLCSHVNRHIKRDKVSPISPKE